MGRFRCGHEQPVSWGPTCETCDRKAKVAPPAKRPRPVCIIFRPGDDNVHRLPHPEELKDMWRTTGGRLIVYGGGPVVTEWCKQNSKYVEQI
jgi:hypothetical protein